MKKLKEIGLYLLKHWRWTLIALCVILFVIFPHKPFGTLVAGMSAIGFLWVSYSLFDFYSNQEPSDDIE
jgi:hypothetical protein